MRRVTTALDVIGAGLVVGGVAMMTVPAAVILAGALVMFVSWRMTR